MAIVALPTGDGHRSRLAGTGVQGGGPAATTHSTPMSRRHRRTSATYQSPGSRGKISRPLARGASRCTTHPHLSPDAGCSRHGFSAPRTPDDSLRSAGRLERGKWSAHVTTLGQQIRRSRTSATHGQSGLSVRGLLERERAAFVPHCEHLTVLPRFSVAHVREYLQRQQLMSSTATLGPVPADETRS